MQKYPAAFLVMATVLFFSCSGTGWAWNTEEMTGLAPEIQGYDYLSNMQFLTNSLQGMPKTFQSRPI